MVRSVVLLPQTIIPALASSVMLIFVLPMHFLASAASQVAPHAQSSGQRHRYDSVGDSFPAPSPTDQNVFVTRVLRWHVHYCGKNRLCKDYEASSCYRCAPCQCDLHCHDYGDCCPDVAMETLDADFPRPFTGSDTNVQTCESATLSVPSTIDYSSSRPIPLEPGTRTVGSPAPSEHPLQNYFMISRCPHSFTADASQCEDNDKVSPVTSAANDSSTTKVFRNIHCARCHSVIDVIPWTLQISCENRKNLTSFITPLDVVSKARLEPDCSVAYVAPEWKEPRKCYTEEDTVARCNVTGKWSKRDSFLERACYSYVTPKRVAGVLYRNVFCYLCNHDDDASVQVLLTSCQKSPLSWSPSMVVTLRPYDVSKRDEDYSPLGDIPYKQCSKHGIYDDKEEVCREVTCALGQHLVSGTCQPMFLTARGLGYELYFGLRPKVPIHLSGTGMSVGDHDLVHHLPAEMEVYLRQTLLKGTVKLQDFAMAFNTTAPDGRCSRISSEVAVYARLVSQTALDQRQLQNDLLRLRHAQFSIETRSWNISFQGFPSESAWHVMHPSKRLFPQTLTTCLIIVSNTHLEQRKDGIIRVGTTTPDPAKAEESQSPPHVRMSNLLACPHVHLFPHEYSASGPDGVLSLEWEDTVLSPNRYIMDLEGNVTICLSDFVRKFGKVREKRSELEQILAAVLLGLSMLCLFVCFLVFLIFAVLRSMPGKNNMVLVVCLFCSQASLLAGFLVDEESFLCAVTGLLAHYFSLCLFCTLTVCCYHVYAMFTTMHLSSNVNKDRKRLVLYCCFTFLLPLLVVAVVVVAYLSKRMTSQEFGYGGYSMCLLSSTIALWVALFVPLMACLIIVTVLYCMTSSSLRHNKDVETSATDERHVNFYFRATVVTAIAWIIGVVGILTSLAPLRKAFIAVQCLLGMYVFVSLVLTPRVTRLLSGACCQSRRPPRGRTSLNMKMASSRDCPVTPPCIMGTGYRKREPRPTGGGIVELPGNRYIKKSEFESAAL